MASSRFTLSELFGMYVPMNELEYGPWHRKFAWLPTWTRDYGWVWFRSVLRRRVTELCSPRCHDDHARHNPSRWEHTIAERYE